MVLRRGDRPARRASGHARRGALPTTRSSACSWTRRSSAAPPALVRAGSAAVRAAQSGFVRYYAALLVLGVTGVGFYFLLQPDPRADATALDPHLAARRRVGLLGASRARRRRSRARAGACWRDCSASLAALALAIGYIADYKAGSAAFSTSPTSSGSPNSASTTSSAIDGLNVFLVGLTTLLFAAAMLAANLRSWERPTALLLPLHARRVRRARRLPRPGPGAVRGLLRPDADPVLLPDRRLGQGARPRESDDQAGDLHVRRLAVDARRRDRHRRAGRPAGRRAHHVRALLAAGAAAQHAARRSGSSCSSPPPSS